MKSATGPIGVVGLLVLTWTLAGCDRAAEQTATPPPAGGRPAATAPSLGTQQPAGPFQVTLSTDPAAPRVGDTRFEARITRDGQPATGATVRVSLSMPSMQMVGPEVSLEPTGDDTYAGMANLSMGGEWQADVSVSAGGESGTAVYQFSASQ